MEHPARIGFCTLAAIAVLSTASYGAPLAPESQRSGPLAPHRAKDARPAERKAEPEPKSEPAQAASEPAEKADALSASVEVYIPSVTRLVDAARNSKTAAIASALGSMLKPRDPDSTQGVDAAALFSVLEQIKHWPDTSLAFSVYTKDADGRPRWALRVDWPVDELRKRIEIILKDESARKALGDISLRRGPDGIDQLEMPDLVLGVLAGSTRGAWLKSAASLKPRRTAYELGTAYTEEQDAALLFCRQSLIDAQQAGVAGVFTGIRDVRYEISLNRDGRWDEQFGMGWSPLIGLAIKSRIKSVSQQFQVPRASFATAAFNVDLPGAFESPADALSGLPKGTVGDRGGSDLAVAVVPGTGFIPVPDLFYQVHIQKPDAVIESIRKAIATDTGKRRDEDRRPAWREQKIDDAVLFWNDPAAREGGGIMPFMFRTVVFIDDRQIGKSTKPRLVIVQTTTQPEDAVHRWRALTRARANPLTIPEDANGGWQARIRWRAIYSQLQPWVSVLAAFADDAVLPPTAEQLSPSLPDSTLDIQTSFSGLQVEHVGPVPFGAVYVPAVVATSVSSEDSANSESARETVACRNLRVLYYHARLFRKDFKRWPVRVSELDGYIDFRSNPGLLNLRPRDDGVIAGLARAITQPKKPRPADNDADSDSIDDSLYEIESHGDAWTLRLREREFKNLTTISIDSEGKIHRIHKD